jgi:hypothetical protein
MKRQIEELELDSYKARVVPVGGAGHEKDWVVQIYAGAQVEKNYYVTGSADFAVGVAYGVLLRRGDEQE